MKSAGLKLLLDTHLLLWWLAKSSKLPQEARLLISAPENTIFVSAVSLWEIRLKQSLEKLRLPADFDGVLAGESFEHLPLTWAHTRKVLSLPWHHRDPFDRMLVAQAQAEKLVLLSADERVPAYGNFVRAV